MVEWEGQYSPQYYRFVTSRVGIIYLQVEIWRIWVILRAIPGHPDQLLSEPVAKTKVRVSISSSGHALEKHKGCL